VHVHIGYDIAIAILKHTEVIQLPNSRQQACFINVEVWLVTLTDENAWPAIGHVMYDHALMSN